MWNTLPAHTPLYRASWLNDTWEDVLQGYGSFFTDGGRYNMTHQQTIYAAQDPLVALTEFGWHAGLKLCEDLGNGVPLAYPLTATGKLWQFVINTPLTLVDVTHPACAHRFNYAAHAAYNPHPDRYRSCRDVANQLRQWAHPPAPHTRPEGLLAPSIRTSGPANYTAQQVVLFVMPAPAVVPVSLQSRGGLIDSWGVALEFLTDTGQPVTSIAPVVGWRNPRFRLSGSQNAVPRCPVRPRSRSLPVNNWQSLDIQYTPY